jgi:hypothetical protein
MQDEDTAPRKQWCVHFERGIFCRGTDEGDCAVFDVRQDGVLLPAIKTVDLVDKQNRVALLEVAALLRLPDGTAEVGDAG